MAQDATPEATEGQAQDVNALVVLYNHPDDSAAFQDYVATTHLPLVWEVQGIKSLIIHSGMVLPEFIPGDIYQIGTVVFASQAAMEEALASDEGQTALADVGNFATGGFAAYFAHIATLQGPDNATPAA